MRKIKTLFLKDPTDLSRIINVIDPDNQWVIDGEGIATRKFDGSASMVLNKEPYKRYDAKLKTEKKLKKLNYYLDILEVGDVVVKTSKNKFHDNSLTDTIIGFGTHSRTGCKSAILMNNGEMDCRQLRPINKVLPLKYYGDIPNGAIPCQEPDLISGHWPHWIKCDRNKPEDAYHFEAFDKLIDPQDGTYELCGVKVKSNPEHVDGHVFIKHGSVVIDDLTLTFDGLREYLSKPQNDIEGIVFHHKNDDRMCKIRKVDFGFKR